MDGQISQATPMPALVLGGGGALGSTQAACIKAAYDRGFRPALIVGTSVGALNGAWVAMNPDQPDALIDIWKGLHRFHVLQFNPLRMAVRLAWPRGGLSANLIVPQLIAEHLGPASFEQAQIPLAVVATNLSDGCKAVFRSGRLDRAIAASTAIPGVFDPVEIEGKLYVDGSITASVDIATAIDLGATEILAFDLTPAVPRSRPRSPIGVLRRSLQVLAHATTDAMEAIAERQVPTCVIRPDLARLSAWRVDFDRAGIARALAQAHEALAGALAPDGHVLGTRVPARSAITPRTAVVDGEPFLARRAFERQARRADSRP